MPYDQRGGNQNGFSTRGRGRSRPPYQRQQRHLALGQVQQTDRGDHPPKAIELPDLPGVTRVWDNRLEQAFQARESLEKWEKYINTKDSLVHLTNLRDAPGGNLLMVRLESVRAEADSRARSTVFTHFASRRSSTDKIIQTLEEKINDGEGIICEQSPPSASNDDFNIDVFLADRKNLSQILKHPSVSGKIDSLVSKLCNDLIEKNLPSTSTSTNSANGE